jgi:hypothetical protein
MPERTRKMKRLIPFLLVFALAVSFMPVCFGSAVGTITVTQRTYQGGKQFVYAHCPLSTSYTTGGDTITAVRLGLTHLDTLIVLNPQAGGYVLGWNGTTTNTAKIQCYGPNAAGTVSGIGSAAVTDTFPYVKASITAADNVTGSVAFSTAAAALGANYNWISVTAVPSNGVAETLAHQPDVPRNISIVCHNINGGTVANAATSWAIVGTFNGAAQTETIAIPAVSNVNGNMIYKTGAKPFDTITSITPTITGGTEVSGYQTAIGISSKIGLSRGLLTPAVADVLIATQTAVPVVLSSGNVVATAGIQNVNFATITANDYLVVKYMTAAYTATPTITGAEAEASGSLSAVTVYLVAIGY